MVRGTFTFASKVKLTKGSMMIQDNTEYATAWSERDSAESADGQPDEFALKGENEERSLAEKLASGEGEKLAAADGFRGDGVMTTAEHKAYFEATGEHIDGSKPSEPTVKPFADQVGTVTLDNVDGLRAALKRRGLSDQEIERQIDRNKKAKGLR
jgi:hypothetical protein